MIIEAKSVRGSAKGLRYQSDDRGLSVEISRNGLMGDDPNDWHVQMSDHEANNSRAERRRLTIVISPSKEASANLTASDWAKLVDETLSGLGIDRENHQYISHLHGSTDDPHCHITLSRIPLTDRSLKFSAVSDNNIGTRAGKTADAMARSRGWKTAREISREKKDGIAAAVRTVLKSAKNYGEFSEKMLEKGYDIRYSHNTVKGIYGLRIVPVGDINKNPSERVENAKEGYKLSEIEKFEGYKATFRIPDLVAAFERNTLNTYSPKQLKAHYEAVNQKILEGGKNMKDKNTSIVEAFLKPDYVAPMKQEPWKRKKRR